MEIFAKLESWDYRLQNNDPERVDAKKLRICACGGLVAGALYLACRYLQL